MESKKRILEEAVDTLNEEIAQLSAKGENHFENEVPTTIPRGSSRVCRYGHTIELNWRIQLQVLMEAS